MLQKYGAIKTKTIRLSNKYTATFAKFTSPQLAAEALLRLHQLNVREQYLTVEYAHKSIEFSEQDVQHEVSKSKDDTKEETASKAHIQAFLRKLNNWTMNHDFSQLPPPNIKYKYPPPTKNTLIRIAIMLIEKPVFYTQVNCFTVLIITTYSIVQF